MSDPLLEIFTAGYTPQATTGYISVVNRLPVFLRDHVPDMLREPRISLGLKTIKGPILSKCRFYVRDEQSKPGKPSPIKKFICDQITRFWENGVETALTSLEYGFSGSEVVYRIHDDDYCYDHLEPLQQRDIRLQIKKKTGKKDCIKVVRNDSNSSSHKPLYIGGIKSLWCVQNRDFHKYYGRSVLYGAFQPWMDLYADGGAHDVRRLYYHKYAYSGDIIYYPPGATPGTTSGPGADPDGSRANKQLARQLINQRRSGAALAFPNKRDEKGNRLWEIDEAKAGPSVTNMLEYYQDLKKEIFEGMGIPPEVLEASEVGSGWSGRSIPQHSFFTTLHGYAAAVIRDFNEQIIAPLIRLNYQTDYDYSIVPFGLVRDSESDENADKEAVRGQPSAGPVPPEYKEQFGLAV